MNILAKTIEYLLSFIIFMIFLKFGYWLTGATIDLMTLLVLFLIMFFGNTFGNIIGAAVYEIIIKGTDK